MQAEGEQKRAEAEAKNKISEQKQNAQGHFEDAKGNVKETVGSVIGNEQMVRMRTSHDYTCLCGTPQHLSCERQNAAS